MRLRYSIAVLSLLAVVLWGDPSCLVNAEENDGDRLREAVTRAICERNGYPPEQLEITLHSVHPPEAAEDADEVVAEVPDYDDAIGPVTLKAQFRQNGQTLAKISVPVRVMVFAEVLITAKKLNRHHVLRAGDVRRDRVDITNLVKWAVSDPDTAIGRRTIRTINPGSIVDRRWLADVPLVQRGERVTMASQNNGVNVSGMAVALEDGYRDQEITVKAEWANRILRAVVVDAGTVAPVR